VPCHLPRNLGRISAGELRHEICNGISARQLRLHPKVEQARLHLQSLQRPHWRSRRRTADADAAADAAAAVIQVAFVVCVRVIAIVDEAGLRALSCRGKEAPRRLNAGERHIAYDGGIHRTRANDPALRRLLTTHQ